MRILMYSAIFPPAIGGPATQCFNLCKALVERGEVPIVVTYGSNFSSNEDQGFKVMTFRLRYTYTPLDKALRWVIFPLYISFIFQKEKIDILHCHSASAASFLAGFLAKIFGIPSVIKFAGDWVWETLSTYKLQAKNFDEMYEKSWLARAMVRVEKVGLNLFDKIWVVSDFRRENIKTLLGNDKKVVMINNCLLLRGGGARNFKEGEMITVISASRYIPHKRLPFLVELFALSDIPNSKLVLIGSGSDQEVDLVKEAIKKFKVEDRVMVRGILESNRVYEEFSKASFYISTSIEEGLPNVFIEAMHYGLPIITADAGGCREMVLNNKTGFVVDVYDKETFLEKIKILSTDTDLRTQMSHEAFERSKLFNLEHKIGEFLKMYQDLLSK